MNCIRHSFLIHLKNKKSTNELQTSFFFNSFEKSTIIKFAINTIKKSILNSITISHYSATKQNNNKLKNNMLYVHHNLQSGL